MFASPADERYLNKARKKNKNQFITITMVEWWNDALITLFFFERNYNDVFGGGEKKNVRVSII